MEMGEKDVELNIGLRRMPMGYPRKIAPTMTGFIGGRRGDRPVTMLCGFEQPERVARRIVG
jgi:hypothetical protein